MKSLFMNLKRPFLALTLLLLCFSSVQGQTGEEREAPDGVEIRRDVTFLAADREEKLDVYQPAGHSKEERLPAVVIIHGGGWVRGDKGREREFVSGTMLAKAGYVAISINYETRKHRRWPNNLHDCKNAVRWLRANAEELGVDSENIGVIGGSAGGHLALMVAYTAGNADLSSEELYPGVSDSVKACVDMYGITNLLTRKQLDDEGIPTGELKEHRLFAQTREEAPGLWRRASPVNYVTSKSPPTFVIHGTRDDIVDVDQSKELYEKLQKEGVESTLRLVEGAKHAWALKSKNFDLRPEVLSFFDAHLKGQDSKPQVKEEASVILRDNKKRPNVLFIAVDDLNDWGGSLGGNKAAITPNMDRLFKEGVLFSNAHCSQAICSASRNSILSGLHPSSSGWYGSTKTMQNSYEDVMGEHTMLPQYFKENGYKTMAVGKIYHAGVSDYKERTDDFWHETGPKYSVRGELRKRGDGYGGTKFYPFPKGGSQMVAHYGEDYADGNSLSYGPLDREDMPDGRMYDEIIAEWACERISEEQEEPFFLAVGFVRPHAPFTAPREFFDLYDLDAIEIPSVPDDEMSDVPMLGKAISYGRLKGGDHYAVKNLSDTFWQEMVYGYLASVSFVDAQIGKVMEALEKSGHADNTLIVLWSDHGQHLGEKRKWRKQSLWEEATRVPLFFKAPGMTRGGEVCDEVVSLLDIYPTLLDACELPAASKLQGQSLTPFLKDPEKDREEPVLMSWRYGNHAVRSKDWRYIQYRDGTEELYRHPQDSGEHRNLANRPESQEVIQSLKKWIPKKPALPSGDTEWGGDKLDRRVKEWEESGVPEWLK